VRRSTYRSGEINPDGGISFQRKRNEGTPYEFKSEPSGTNLLDASQADAMVRYMIEGMPDERQKNIMFQPPFEIYHNNNEIADSNGHVCTAENPEIARMILLALRAYYEPSTDKVPHKRIDDRTAGKPA
jgi:hypothetical protein